MLGNIGRLTSKLQPNEYAPSSQRRFQYAIPVSMLAPFLHFWAKFFSLINAGISPSPSHSHARISRTRFFAASRLHRGASEYSSNDVSSSSGSFATSDPSSLLVDAVDTVDVVAVLARLNQLPLVGKGGVRGDDGWVFIGRGWVFLGRSL